MGSLRFWKGDPPEKRRKTGSSQRRERKENKKKGRERKKLVLISRFCMILGLFECMYDVEMIKALLFILFQPLSQKAIL